MKVLILAGGYARRLLPLTENKPKPLLPVRGRPIIDY
ncbi:MAG: sugar phosphate nucleotidyltransferase, partial [Candidatus Bathyarchaeota archaeon]